MRDHSQPAIRPIPLLLLLILALGMGARAEAQGTGETYACASRPDIVGPCFEVRGRLSFWNGAPSARIWPVGTKRVLGVHSDVLPPTLAAKLHSFDPQHTFDTEVWTNFTLCPFTQSEAGHMQFVCIESWHSLSIRHREK